MTRTVTIIVHEGVGLDHSHFDVFDGNGNFADSLGWDEMLGCVSELTHQKLRTSPYPARYIKTPDAFMSWWLRYRARPVINEIR